MASPIYDMGGNTLVIDNIKIGATAPGQAGTDLSVTELGFLDTVTAGTVTASKAVVVDASKNISTFGTIGSAAITSSGPVTALNATATPAGGTAGSGFLISSTANLGIFWGSGAPTLSAAQGSLYIRTDGSSTSTRLYVNTTGATTWTNVTTAA